MEKRKEFRQAVFNMRQDMKKKQVLIVGGGAAGMMAACGASEAGHEVTLLERNGRLGKKLALTGNGRCNVTNASDPETLLDHIVSNRNFLYSAFYGFSNEDMVRFLREEGLETKEEDHYRVFPVTDRAADVIRALEHRMTAGGVRVLLNRKVEGLLIEPVNGADSQPGSVCRGVILSDGEKITADVTILATGGLSYPVTGSDGSGMRMAEAGGHAVRPPRPALTPFVIRESWGKELQGRVFQDIRMTVSDPQGHRLFDGRGDVLFTHFGISGPMVLTASSYCTDFFSSQTSAEAGISSEPFSSVKEEHAIRSDKKSMGRRQKGKKPENDTGSDHPMKSGSVRRELTVKLDFFPDLNTGQLDQQLLDNVQGKGRKQLRTVLESVIPKALVPVLLEQTGVDPGMKAAELPRQTRQELIRHMKELTLHVTGVKGFREAMITQGGIRVSEVDPVTMESLRVNGLRFAGEILDLDALTGGFNLQIAWSTGWAAGSTI